MVQLGGDKSVSLPRATLPDILLDPNSQILFLGEGNFTFSFSFACLRGSWENLVVTAYHEELPTFEQAQMDTIRNILDNLRWSPEEPALQYIRTVSSFRKPEIAWLHSIDATNIPDALLTPIIWFQCPWVTRWKRTPDLLKNFFQHAGEKQQPGDIVILGIISKQPYCESYALDFLAQGTEHYEFLGADNHFITHLLKRGYKHQGIRDIHRIIYDTHLSLLFRHK